MEDQSLFLLVHITKSFCSSFPPILFRRVLRMRVFPSPSLSPFPMALDSVSFTSWQGPAAGFPACPLQRQETQKGRLGDHGQPSQWPNLCSTPAGHLQGHPGSRATKPGPQTHKNLWAPTLVTPKSGSWNQFVPL